MHELSLMEGVLAIVLDAQKANGFQRVSRIVLEVGELSGALPEALEFCFSAVMQDSPAEGAELELVIVPGQGWCGECLREFHLESRIDLCPDCGGPASRISGGLDLQVKSLVVDPAPGAP
jgi:hydrogenase nickel incorporation protein HypA/HybF